MPYGPIAQAVQLIPTQQANPFSTQLFAQGPLNLFSQLYVPIRRGNSNTQSGGLLLSTPKQSYPTWWHLQVWGRELVDRIENIDDLRAAGELESLVKGGAVGTVPARTSAVGAQRGVTSSQASALKVAIEYVEYPTQRRRRIVQDIGSCFDMPLGPTQQIDVDLLAPDPNGYPGPFPGGYSPEVQGFATWVVAQCQPCVNGTMARDHGARFTQNVAIGLEAGETCIPIADGARNLQIFAENDGALPAQWRYENGGDPPIPRQRFGFRPGLFTTERVIIPQTAKAVCLSRNPNVDVDSYVVVQELQL